MTLVAEVVMLLGQAVRSGGILSTTSTLRVADVLLQVASDHSGSATGDNQPRMLNKEMQHLEEGSGASIQLNHHEVKRLTGKDLLRLLKQFVDGA